MQRVLASLIAVVAAFPGCGKSADDIARGIDDAVRATKPKPGLKLPPQARAIPEDETESAAKRAVCDALEAYSADPSKSLSEYIQDYASRQRFLADFNLNDIDPDEADRLADAASDINDSQEAAEVANELLC